MSSSDNIESSFKDLIVYKKAFEMAMDIFRITKSFPVEERYSLTDQVRRSSRSVCSNLAESYRKRQYQAHFLSKISDADMENSETQVWIDFSLQCGYITSDTYNTLLAKTSEIGRILNHMTCYPEKFVMKSRG